MVISELRDAMAALPPEVRQETFLGADPLPPPDSRCAYTRPERSRPLGNDSFLGSFLRSILPNYEPVSRQLLLLRLKQSVGYQSAAHG